MGWHSYVAVGDSFTEGLDDPYPDGTTYRGWADLVAGHLASGNGAFRYANLAIRGRLFDQVVDEQVPAAVAMRPDLVSFAAGGNDVLRRGFDLAAVAERFDAMVAQIRATGADLLLFRCADLSVRLPGRRLLRPRIEALNEVVARCGERHGARVVDMWADDGFADPRLWSVDRLHLSAAGHRRTAARVLEALGVAPDQAWLESDPPLPPARWLTARTTDLRWARQYLAPWLRRRLTGRSSGDARHPKRPVLDPLDTVGP